MPNGFLKGLKAARSNRPVRLAKGTVQKAQRSAVANPNHPATRAYLRGLSKTQGTLGRIKARTIILQSFMKSKPFGR